MAKRKTSVRGEAASARRPSALIDPGHEYASRAGTRVIYCGDGLAELGKLPDGCIDRRHVWHRFPTGDSNSNRNDEVFRGETKEKRAFENRHESTPARHSRIQLNAR